MSHRVLLKIKIYILLYLPSLVRIAQLIASGRPSECLPELVMTSSKSNDVRMNHTLYSAVSWALAAVTPRRLRSLTMTSQSARRRLPASSAPSLGQIVSQLYLRLSQALMSQWSHTSDSSTNLNICASQRALLLSPLAWSETVLSLVGHPSLIIVCLTLSSA